MEENEDDTEENRTTGTVGVNHYGIFFFKLKHQTFLLSNLWRAKVLVTGLINPNTKANPVF